MEGARGGCGRGNKGRCQNEADRCELERTKRNTHAWGEEIPGRWARPLPPIGTLDAFNVQLQSAATSPAPSPSLHQQVPLMRCSPWETLVTLDMMVMPRSFSSSFRSITRSDVMATLQSRRTRSTSVVLLPTATPRTHIVSGGTPPAEREAGVCEKTTRRGSATRSSLRQMGALRGDAERRGGEVGELHRKRHLCRQRHLPWSAVRAKQIDKHFGAAPALRLAPPSQKSITPSFPPAELKPPPSPQ